MAFYGEVALECHGRALYFDDLTALNLHDSNDPIDYSEISSMRLLRLATSPRRQHWQAFLPLGPDVMPAVKSNPWDQTEVPASYFV
jgi:hypothetical protein